MRFELAGKARSFAMTFDAVETRGIGLNARAKHAAEELRHRLPAHFAGNVPERDVDAADRADHRAFLAVVTRVVVHAVPQHLGLQRILAYQEMLQAVLD